MKIAKKFGVLAAAIALVISSPAIASANETGKESKTSTTRKPTINDVISETKDKCGRHAIMRRGYWNGTSGFGADKIGYRHGLKNHKVFNFLLGNPNCGIPAGGESRRYDGYAHHIQCSPSEDCQIVQIRLVIGIQDYRNDPKIPGQKGLITAYCDGQLVCDRWVDNALNLKSINQFTIFRYQKLDPKRHYTQKELLEMAKRY